MRIRRTTAKALAVLVAIALLAAACGGGSTGDGTVQDDPAVTDGDAPTVVGAVPTTAPVSAPPADDATIAADSDDEAGESVALVADEDPWEVSVLHVKDDVQIVPTFDGPSGAEIKIYDVNEIDNVELEYPLLATTHFGNRLALLVDEYDASGNWAKVQVPVRPNNTTAWVQTAFFTEEKHSYHITIDLSNSLVTVYDGDVAIVDQIAVIGRETRPTPVVRAYIDEKIRGETLSPAYGDWVLSIAGFSETLGTFGGGGMPKLALHGTDQPELVGQAVSSGCVRIPNEVVSLIADLVPVGTVVDIVA